MKETIISNNVIERTFEFLQSLGKKEVESHVLWAGKDENDVFSITDVIIPAQKNWITEFEVDSDEIHRINVLVNKKGLQLIAQIHTHPSIAFHSSVDDEGALLLLPNSLSIVIPNFGFVNKKNTDDWEFYSFDGNAWIHVDKNEVKKSFKII